MAWDPALLRKFNATGHFRLLNQVRSELKANPIKRAAPSPADQASSRGVATGKPLDLRSQGYGRRRSSGSTSSGSSSSSALATPSATLPVAPLAENPPIPSASPSPWGKPLARATPAFSSPPSQDSGFQNEGNQAPWGDAQLESSSTAEAASRSFRDRLNAIQMR